MNINTKAFSYHFLLLEYYKMLGLNDQEAMVLIMIEHLIQEEQCLVTASNLSLRMTASEEELDKIMNDLFMKGFLDIKTYQGKMVTSIDSTYLKLFDAFKDSMIKEDEIFSDETKDKDRKEIIALLEETFGRDLTILEIDSINGWFKADTPKSIIINSIKDAKHYKVLDISMIDRLILKKMREQDKYGNEIK